MQAFQANGATLNYQVIGAPEDKPTIVFVNGLASDQRVWRDVIVRLVGDAGIVTFDQRGHGLSDGGPAESIDAYAADLAALIDHLGSRACVVCGHSAGGHVAQALALSRPDLVGGLVLAGTSLTVGDRTERGERVALVEREGTGAVANATMERWFTAAFLAERASEVALYRNMVARTEANAYVALARATLGVDFRDDAARIAAPTLCLTGEHDRIAPPTLARDLAKAIPGARLEIVKGAAHMLPVEAPEALADMIGAFLSLMGEAKGSA